MRPPACRRCIVLGPGLGQRSELPCGHAASHLRTGFSFLVKSSSPLSGRGSPAAVVVDARASHMRAGAKGAVCPSRSTGACLRPCPAALQHGHLRSSHSLHCAAQRKERGSKASKGSAAYEKDDFSAVPVVMEEFSIDKCLNLYKSVFRWLNPFKSDPLPAPLTKQQGKKK